MNALWGQWKFYICKLHAFVTPACLPILPTVTVGKSASQLRRRCVAVAVCLCPESGEPEHRTLTQVRWLIAHTPEVVHPLTIRSCEPLCSSQAMTHSHTSPRRRSYLPCGNSLCGVWMRSARIYGYCWVTSAAWVEFGPYFVFIIHHYIQSLQQNEWNINHLLSVFIMLSSSSPNICRLRNVYSTKWKRQVTVLRLPPCTSNNNHPGKKFSQINIGFSNTLVLLKY